MDIGQFIKLFKRNLLILIAIPLLLSAVVYFFTRNQTLVYESEVLIYTGITTGYSIESETQQTTNFFTTSAQFDNIIAMLNSRQTIVSTSLWLIAQDLSLEQYNSQYISQDHFNKLQQFMPKRIKDLVVVNNKSGIEREKEQQIQNLEKEITSLEREISKKKNIAAQNKIRQEGFVDPGYESSAGVGKENANTDDESNFIYHEVQQGESLSEIASRYGVSRGPLMDMNGLTTESLSGGQSIIIKRNTPSNISSKYHTVKRGETLYSIAKRYGINISKLREINNLNNRALTPGQKIIIEQGYNTSSNSTYDYAVKQVTPDVVISTNTPLVTSQYDNSNSLNNNDEIITAFGESKGVFQKDPITHPGVNPEDFQKTYNNLLSFYSANDTNFIYGLLHYGQHPHYSIAKVSQIQVYREKNSDMVKIIYSTDDPGICQQTLKILSKVFMKNYKMLRENETNLVIKYFEEQVDLADKKLQEAEDRLLKFNMKNNIINYYEQSKYIASQKEGLDLYYQNEQVRMASSSSALRELETNLTARDSIYLKSDEINQMRKELADIAEAIVLNELSESYDERTKNKLNLLRLRQKELKDNIKLYVYQLYLYSHSTQGMPIKTLLESWLSNTLIYEEAKAALVVLARRKMDFVRTYQKFAPLGAMLKRIEREIKVAEQSYLELLRSLNSAKMKQQRLDMSTNIKIVDPAFFPISPKASKTKLLIAAAFMFGLILVAFTILVLEYFDSSVKSPKRVVYETKLKLAGAYPRIGSKSQANDLVKITNRLIDIIIQNIKLGLNSNTGQEKKPKIVLIVSTQNQMGKTLIGHKLANRFRDMGKKVLYANYSKVEDTNSIEEDYNYSYTYEVKDDFIDIESIPQLLGGKNIRKENYDYDYLFVELPSIVYNNYPLKLIGEADSILFVVSAASSLQVADKTALETFKDSVNVEPMVILNEVELYNLEDLLTSVPKTKRQAAIKKVKYILTYPLKYRIKINKED
ncbi:MAG: hypothetical protein C0598_14310 [Marinilabiliales bacterium]|nr:MAG: hypothetical protein C0598_14310 [Marinilabiliales bacterium]